ncbi:MAG: FHA domain-containing protein, partial [Pyrinomonadaceae bacterium]
MALLHITDASGHQWQYSLSPQSLCTIGRAPDNSVVLNDPRASRYHAHIKFQGNSYLIVDGKVGGGRSANHVFVGGEQRLEHPLRDGDHVGIGASELRFEGVDEHQTGADVRYDDKPLGHTQLLVSASDVIRGAMLSRAATATAAAPNEELEALRRKAKILTLLYEMSKTLSSVFNLDAIFEKATQIIFDATPADRVVALLRDDSVE